MDTSKKLWRHWTLYCAVGELLGIGAAGTIAFGVNSLVGDPQTLSMKLVVLTAMLVAGAIEGSLLGYLQWRVLVLKFHAIPLKEWLLCTVSIAVLGWFLGMLPSLFFAPSSSSPQAQSLDFDTNPLVFIVLTIVLGLVLGALFGLFQWFSLRKYTPDAYKWIIANALGWGAGLGWIYVFASLPSETSPLLVNIIMGVLGGLLAGLSVGAITGWFLVNLRVTLPLNLTR
jgi:hypothetical protein